MIIKYKNGEIWGYLDNVSQIATKFIDTDKLIARYNIESEKGIREDIIDGENEEIKEANKAFLVATEEELEVNCRSFNLLDEKKMIIDWHAIVILAYLDKNKDYDVIRIVTNQEVYILNDEGKTIERLW